MCWMKLIFWAALSGSEFSDELRRKLLEQCQPWIDSKKGRELEDTHTIAKIAIGASIPSEDELMKLAQKMDRPADGTSFLNAGFLLEILLDRQEQAPLEELLQNLPEKMLFGGPFSVFAIQGYEQLGEDDEVELLKEDLFEDMAISWKNAWVEGSVLEYQLAVASYWIIARKEGTPVPVWMKEIPKIMSLEIERVRCEFLLLMTEGKWAEFEKLVKKNLEFLEEAEGRVLRACADLGLKKEGARERATKVLLSPDKRDSYSVQLRQMLKE